jgi:rSAM/selenodomain-associated transferase 1
MLKVPKPGEVKTRLGKETGMNEACNIYQKLAEHQLGEIPYRFRLEIHYAPAAESAQMKAWLGKDRTYVAQAEGNLGDRLTVAAQDVFDRKAEALVFLGGDCPDVTAHLLEEVAAQLAHHDVILGPATDGGYYLIAMTRHHPRLFESVDWSTDRVLGQTKDRIQELGLRMFLLPWLSDVDDLATLRHAREAHAFLR